MKIGYDAKRLFFNPSGLGNYSRSLVWMMSRYYPEDSYTLFTPEAGDPCRFDPPEEMEVVLPDGLLGRSFPSFWRSYRMGSSIRRRGIDLFHGLSNELPADIRRSGARSVVTLHDIIFVRMPELYKAADRRLYTLKYRSSCFNADRVIAISNQTKADLINAWQVPEEKIEVVYQGCNPIFYRTASEVAKLAVRQKYRLPERYLLSVGTIEERKNLMLTIEAMVCGAIDIDLVVCGHPTPYLNTIKVYAQKHGILHRLHFFHEVTLEELPAIYQMAELLVYASFYEGFGIPILEGFESGIPVITSRGGVFSETGGDAARYVDPYRVESMIGALREITDSADLRQQMILRGKAYALRFRDDVVAANIEAVYNKLR
ncbi:MAG: glycosyltransferase family 4 protein [Rikenellaceae bacterium]|jgi:glycosyltransferase involved in cell wall biosynthesis|nr:glycosyltransferase family 4 protein [Rikenellaceae bacterium]